DRIETAQAFAARAVTAPLAASAFRKDRIEVLYEPRSEGIVRILTAGLARWGGPDVEAQAVPLAAAARIADVLLGGAEAIANGANAGPVMLSRADLARARGEAYADDPSLPDGGPMAVELLSVHPEAGDPNDFMARIAPPTGTGPLAFLDLSERFFGSELAAAPGEATLRAAHEKAQRALDGGPRERGLDAAPAPTLRDRRRRRRRVDVDRRHALRRALGHGQAGRRAARRDAARARRGDHATARRGRGRGGRRRARS